MADIINVNMRAQLGVNYTLDLDNPALQNPTLSYGLRPRTVQLDADSEPAAVTKAWRGIVALVAGEASLDLTDLPGIQDAITLAGLKVQAAQLRAPVGNTGAITIEPADSDGFPIGGTGAVIVVPPGGEVTMYTPEGTPDVGASASDVDISGTGTDSIEIVLLAG